MSRLHLLLVLTASLSLSACGGNGAPRAAVPAPTLPPVSVGAAVAVGPTPSALAVGGGAVWVVDAAAGTLHRLDAGSGEITRRVRVSGGPLAVAIGAGAAWVAAGDGTISAYDLRSGRPTQTEAHVPGANGIAAADGGVWVTSRLRGTVTRIDPVSGAADPAIPVGRGPADVAIGAGAVWVLNADEGSVSRIETATAEVTDTVATGAAQARALAVGDDAVWVARARGELGDDLEVVRIDPDDRKLAGDAVSVPGAVPLDLAAADGSVWSTDPGDLRAEGEPRTGGLTRIDAARQAVAGTPLRTGGGASAVAVGDGMVWVASTQDGTVTPVTAGG